MFNDSLSYYFHSDDRREALRTKPGVSEPRNHGKFYKSNTRQYFDVIDLPKFGDAFLVAGDIPAKPIHIDSTIKLFKGWRCREAYVVKSPGDTLFALLAIDYPFPFGPGRDNYFPYLAVEIYHPLTNQNIIASKIELIDTPVLFPKHIPILSEEDWIKIRDTDR